MIASHFLSKMWGVRRAKLLTKCQMFILKSAPAPIHAMYVRCGVERARLVVLVLRARLAVRCGAVRCGAVRKVLVFSRLD